VNVLVDPSVCKEAGSKSAADIQVFQIPMHSDNGRGNNDIQIVLVCAASAASATEPQPYERIQQNCRCSN
jgi:hypothetical protein